MKFSIKSLIKMRFNNISKSEAETIIEKFIQNTPAREKNEEYFISVPDEKRKMRFGIRIVNDEINVRSYRKAIQFIVNN